MKSEILSIAILFLLFNSIAKTMFAQDEEISKQRSRDTLNFEYEGSLLEHEQIILRNFSTIYGTRGLTIEGYEYVDVMKYPIVTSYIKKTGSLVDAYLRKNATITKVKRQSENSYYNKYQLNNCFYLFSDDWLSKERETAGEDATQKYIEVLTCWNNILLYQQVQKIFSKPKVKDMGDEEFTNLVSKAYKNGIKNAATMNGFYNRELARQLSKQILQNRIEELLKSNQTLEFRVLHISDTYSALQQLIKEGQWEGQEKKQQDATLEIMFKKYPSK